MVERWVVFDEVEEEVKEVKEVEVEDEFEHEDEVMVAAWCDAISSDDGNDDGGNGGISSSFTLSITAGGVILTVNSGVSHLLIKSC